MSWIMEGAVKTNNTMNPIVKKTRTMYGRR